MSSLIPQCQQLEAQVESILQLLHQEAALRSQDITPVQISSYLRVLCASVVR